MTTKLSDLAPEPSGKPEGPMSVTDALSKPAASEATPEPVLAPEKVEVIPEPVVEPEPEPVVEPEPAPEAEEVKTVTEALTEPEPDPAPVVDGPGAVEASTPAQTKAELPPEVASLSPRARELWRAGNSIAGAQLLADEEAESQAKS